MTTVLIKSHEQWLSVITYKVMQAVAISDYDHYKIVQASFSDYDTYQSHKGCSYQ